MIIQYNSITAPRLIKNSIIEEIFWDDAIPEQKAMYVKIATSGNEHATAQATAYASKFAREWHKYRKDKERRLGIDHEYVAYMLFERDRANSRRVA